MRHGALASLLPRWLVTRRLNGNASKAVLLTFDDGPDERLTPGVLERLEAYGARAVFFVVGHRFEQSPWLAQRMVDQGHLIGNHTYSHALTWFGWSLRPRLLQFYRDTRRCQGLIERYATNGPRLFRPPGGCTSPSSLLTAKLLHSRCITWSVEIRDWSFRVPAAARAGAETLLQLIVPGDIVLLHDEQPCIHELLDVLLPGLKDRGFDLSSGIDRLCS